MARVRRRRFFSPFETSWANVGAALVVLGVVLRVLAVLRFEPNIDAYWYAIDGQHALWEIWTSTPDGGLPRSPVYATAIHLVDTLVGDTALALQVTSLTTSLALLAGVLWTSNDLWGERVAWQTTAVVALHPLLITLTGWSYALNLAFLFFTLTLWAIMKSIEAPPYIAMAGVFASLTYLTRSSMGPFFVIAAGMGVLWRLIWGGNGTAEGSGDGDEDGYGAFNRYYLTGGLVFGSTVLAWSLHNHALVGRFTSNRGVREAALAIGPDLGTYAGMLLVQLVFLGGVWLAYAGYFAPELAASLKRAVDDELESGLWVAVASIIVTAAAITAAFWLVEDNPLMRAGHVRYVTMAVLPLCWIVFPDRTGSPDAADTPDASARSAPSASDPSPSESSASEPSLSEPSPSEPSTARRVATVAAFAALTLVSRAWTVGVGLFQGAKGISRGQRLMTLLLAMALVSVGTLAVIAPATTHPGRSHALQQVGDAARPGDALYVQEDPGGAPARRLTAPNDMVKLWAPQVAKVDSLADEPEWVIRWQPFAEDANPGYVLVSEHRDATGFDGALLATLSIVDVRNAEAYVYHRCPDAPGEALPVRLSADVQEDACQPDVDPDPVPGPTREILAPTSLLAGNGTEAE